MFCAGCQYKMLEASRSSDYNSELKLIDAELERSRRQLAEGGSEKEVFRHIYHLYRHASLTNNFVDYRETDTVLRRAWERYGPSRQWYLFSAHFNFKLHRLEAAKADLIKLDRYGGSPQGEILKADIALQQGNYHLAGQAYAAICRENPSWDNLARLAYFKLHTGAGNEADRVYQQAQDQLSSKQMRHFAWLELQRGLIDLEYRHYQRALEHYLLAEEAYSGYWLIREHIAEAYALMGRRQEAIELYQSVIEQTRSPDFINALATIYEDEGDSRANELYAEADESFSRQYRLFPEAAVGHFVESLLKRRQPDRRVLDYAIRNHQWRPNGRAKYLLAKAQQQVGEAAAAKALMQNILSSPWWSGDVETLAMELGMNHER